MATSSRKNTRFLPDSEEFNYEEFPFYWLARVHAIYMLEMEKVLKRLGTDIPTRRVLLTLKLHGTASVSELATHAVNKMSTITRIVQRMRDEGLVETSTNPDDARITDVSMTRKGEELAALIEQVTQKIVIKGYQGLSGAQLENFMKTLQVIFRNFSDN